MEISPKKTNETDSQTAERIKQHEEVAMQPKDKYSYFYVTLGILTEQMQELGQFVI